MDFALLGVIEEMIYAQDLEGAERYLEEMLSVAKVDHFKALCGNRFSNDPSDVLRQVNEFIADCQRRFDVTAVYLEMMGSISTLIVGSSICLDTTYPKKIRMTMNGSVTRYQATIRK